MVVQFITQDYFLIQKMQYMVELVQLWPHLENQMAKVWHLL